MSLQITQLPPKKRGMGFAKLGEFGIDAEQWLAMLNASDAEMQKLSAAWPIFQSSYAYDATGLLGFGEASRKPLPMPAPGEVVIRYGGWSINELQDSEIGKKLMNQDRYFDEPSWCSKKLPAGIYRLCIPVHNSNNKTFSKQQQLLSKEERVAPVVLVATAILSHHLQKNEDLLQGKWTRCKERDANGCRVELFWREGLLCAHNSHWKDGSHARMWLSSIRTFPAPSA